MSAITKSTLVSLAEAALITGYTKAWLLKLSKDGAFAKQRRGEYLLCDVVQGILRNLATQKKAVSQTTALTRVQHARALLLEQRIMREAGELYAKADVHEWIEQVIGGMVSRLDSLPSQVTREPELRRKIEDAVNQIRMDHVIYMKGRAAELEAEAIKRGIGVPANVKTEPQEDDEDE